MPGGLYTRLCHAFLGLLYYSFFLTALILIFFVLAKGLAGKSVSDMTHIVSSGTLTLINLLFVTVVYDGMQSKPHSRDISPCMTLPR